LPWLFGVGAVLFVAGLLARELAVDLGVVKLGCGAASAGWRLVLLATTIYLLIWVLASAFDGFMPNLPGG
jgi:hypothetical protein